MLTLLAILITKENTSNIKTLYSKLGDWIDITTLLYENTLKQSMIDKKIDEKEVLGLITIHYFYPDKRKEIMKNTQFKIEDILFKLISKHTTSPEQTTKRNSFLTDLMWI